MPFLLVYFSEFEGEAVLVRHMKAYGEWRSSATHFDLGTRRRYLKPPGVEKRKLTRAYHDSILVQLVV